MSPLGLLSVLCLLQPLSLRYVPKDGDLIFHTSQSRQSKAIQSVTRSRFSHMGIVFLKRGVPYVYEAVGPVKYTPLKEWIDRGVDGRYSVKRLASSRLSAAQVTALKSAASKYEGREYDSFFDWSDKQIYCSELAWKIYKSALGLEVGTMQRFGEFDLTNPLAKAIIQQRWGGRPPLNEPVITPASIFDSSLLRLVYQR